ncbi:hypothetical protein ET495_16365 [Xylanimonas allomyrinae]|uniref:Uncharacterized protein n=1 Tax=Xylanimonas allomyrinae TaxID=2509459 RepID=A0A4V0YEK4_9MICO|nr:hypothetical protein [Xylanimonas allomyrinae]QAY64521.1 hypothetical protein ET495_16365 [Xylanimonas allomyrinae]
MKQVRRGRLFSWQARRIAPARRFVVALAPDAALHLADHMLRSRHFKPRATGPSGVRFYRYGTWVGSALLADFRLLAPFFPEPLRRTVTFAQVAVEATPARPAAHGTAPTWLTVAAIPDPTGASACVTGAIEAIEAELAERRALIHAEPPTSTYDLDGDGIRPERFQPPRRA